MIINVKLLDKFYHLQYFVYWDKCSFIYKKQSSLCYFEISYNITDNPLIKSLRNHFYISNYLHGRDKHAIYLRNNLLNDRKFNQHFSLYDGLELFCKSL
jgi:hypothetical protein